MFLLPFPSTVLYRNLRKVYTYLLSIDVFKPTYKPISFATNRMSSFLKPFQKLNANGKQNQPLSVARVGCTIWLPKWLSFPKIAESAKRTSYNHNKKNDSQRWVENNKLKYMQAAHHSPRTVTAVFAPRIRSSQLCYYYWSALVLFLWVFFMLYLMLRIQFSGVSAKTYVTTHDLIGYPSSKLS